MIVVATDAPLDARDLEAAGRARHLRARADRLDVLERQRRLRDRVLDERRQSRSRPRTDRSRERFFRPTRCRDCSRPRWMRPKKRSTTRCCKATDTTGNGRTVRALPIDELRAVLGSTAGNAASPASRLGPAQASVGPGFPAAAAPASRRGPFSSHTANVPRWARTSRRRRTRPSC